MQIHGGVLVHLIRELVHCKNFMALTTEYAYLSSMFVLSMPGRCKEMERMCKMCRQSSKKCRGLSDSLKNTQLSVT